MKNLIYIISGLVYIVAGAVLLSTEKKAVDKIVYSEQKLEQQRLVAYIYNLNYLIK